MFFQPLTAWRHAKVTAQRTNIDFAHCLRELVDVHFPYADKIRLVLDNLNTHSPASLYEAFSSHEAQRILSKLAFHFTPKHGSWLNRVEIELASLSKQCLNRRIPDRYCLQPEVLAWEMQRNRQRATVNWRFSVTDARATLKRLYPVLSS